LFKEVFGFNGPEHNSDLLYSTVQGSFITIPLHWLVNMITCTCTLVIFTTKKPWSNSVHCMCIVMMSSDTWMLIDCFQSCLYSSVHTSTQIINI
jgi:hypothetical protein